MVKTLFLTLVGLSDDDGDDDLLGGLGDSGGRAHQFQTTFDDNSDDSDGDESFMHKPSKPQQRGSDGSFDDMPSQINIVQD
jgi:hypothetical protein